MTTGSRVATGDPAPDFTLPGWPEAEYSLADYRGRPVVLVFYPGDATPVCTTQLTSYNEQLRQFDDLGAQILAISPQGVDSHREWSRERAFQFPLLADTDKAVGEAYGLVGQLGSYRRSVFVVDSDGVLRYVHRALAAAAFQPASTLLDALKGV
jgi:thioredoxin-dependent peroxiredoxin